MFTFLDDPKLFALFFPLKLLNSTLLKTNIEPSLFNIRLGAAIKRLRHQNEKSTNTSPSKVRRKGSNFVFAKSARKARCLYPEVKCKYSIICRV